MGNFRMTIQYDGGRYKGWQRLGGEENTIQGKLEDVLKELVGKEVEVIGSGRTDAGVHALAQVANFKTDKELTSQQVKTYLNRYLPQDICVTKVEAVPGEFHSRFHAKEKTYLYRIWNHEVPNPFYRKYSMHVEKKLEVENMKKAARVFIGQHDFTAFTNAKSKSKSMVRIVHAIDIEEEGGFLQIRVRGDGFLHNMVRRIVGTLIDVGTGAVPFDAVPGIIESKERSQAGSVAEACGLFLERVGL